MKMLKKILGCFIFIFLLAQLSAIAQITAIKAGKLVVPETGETLTNQTILVEGAKIKAIGANLQIPVDTKVIDLSRSTVLPSPMVMSRWAAGATRPMS